MSVRIETVNNPRVIKFTNEKLAEDVSAHEFWEGEEHDEILALDYDEVVVITGDLNRFARNVWRAVFGTEPGEAVAR